MFLKTILLLLLMALPFNQSFAQQTPPIEAGVSRELARWRAAHYSDVRYKLNLTLEKQSPTLKGSIEINVTVGRGDAATRRENGGNSNVTASPRLPLSASQIILDWRKIKGKEQFAGVSNVKLNGEAAKFEEINEHLVFREGVKAGENVISLDFTSPIATSGAAVTRYVDKEDGAEYIYSLFVPSDASTAFPCFDQPDLKARFTVDIWTPKEWTVVTNALKQNINLYSSDGRKVSGGIRNPKCNTQSGIICSGERVYVSETTQPISTYVFAFAAGDFAEFDENKTSIVSRESGEKKVARRETSGTSKQSGFRAEGAAENEASRTFSAPKSNTNDSRRFTSGYLRSAPSAQKAENISSKIYVRKSQAEKFKQHAAEVFRLNREAVKYLETYFDYKFPFPKYDLVLIPEFPFGGMEHAGATFLREDRVIFPSEPTANDYITRGNLIFHEAAHQWFGDTVTMRWFDDLWLKEGFAEFMAYKTMSQVLPQYNAWKAFYERNKPLAYLTDSTRGTTPIYQEIPNLSAAKSAYGNIVYRKAPSFLRQAEFYLGEDKFQTAVRAFLKQNAFKNAEWQDLVMSFQLASDRNLQDWASTWVRKRGLPVFRMKVVREEAIEPGIKSGYKNVFLRFSQSDILHGNNLWQQKVEILYIYDDDKRLTETVSFKRGEKELEQIWGVVSPKKNDSVTRKKQQPPKFIFPNHQDYGYGIFLLDERSRNYVLANINNEKDDFLRAMMWGALWDSVREAELNPKDYVELAIKNLALSPAFRRQSAEQKPPEGGTQNGETDELTIQTILGRVGTAMNYYLPEPQAKELAPQLEKVLIERMTNAETLGQRIVFYRAFVNLASTEQGKQKLKDILNLKFQISNFKLKTKDKFDIVTRLLILNDADAPKLLEDLAKTETSDEAKRYAYAARAGIATAENKAKFFDDFVNNKEISESWIESAFVPFNSTRHKDLTLPYLEKALAELPNLKRNRKIFFVNWWLSAFIGGQRDEKALAIVNKFLADNPNLDKDLQLKILEVADGLERSIKIRKQFTSH